MDTIDNETGIDYVRQILLGNGDYNYDRVYYSSNENLDGLFKNVDMKDKKVLTVQASSDQLFHISSKKPASIETFDMNRLTKFYYYLRKWYILYEDEFYFNVYNTENIYELLQKVIPTNEEEYDAYLYWIKFVKTIPKFFIKDLYFISSNPHKNEIHDLRRLKDFLVDYKLRFNGMDITKERLDKKYDTIVISNILEYYDEDLGRITDIRNNLCRMLNDDGEVIASNLMNDYISYAIYAGFYRKFEINEIFDHGRSIGCVYKKKRDVNKK